VPGIYARRKSLATDSEWIPTMPVGKAKAVGKDEGGEGFNVVVPCLISLDEANIREHLKQDRFFWLDLPGHL
jgi:hypothetical protein